MVGSARRASTSSISARPARSAASASAGNPSAGSALPPSRLTTASAVSSSRARWRPQPASKAGGVVRRTAPRTASQACSTSTVTPRRPNATTSASTTSARPARSRNATSPPAGSSSASTTRSAAAAHIVGCVTSRSIASLSHESSTRDRVALTDYRPAVSTRINSKPPSGPTATSDGGADAHGRGLEPPRSPAPRPETDQVPTVQACGPGALLPVNSIADLGTAVSPSCRAGAALTCSWLSSRSR